MQMALSVCLFVCQTKLYLCKICGKPIFCHLENVVKCFCASVLVKAWHQTSVLYLMVWWIFTYCLMFPTYLNPCSYFHYAIFKQMFGAMWFNALFLLQHNMYNVIYFWSMTHYTTNPTECRVPSVECPSSVECRVSSVHRVSSVECRVSSVRRVSTECPPSVHRVTSSVHRVTSSVHQVTSSVHRVSTEWRTLDGHPTDTRWTLDLTRRTLDVTRRTLDGHSTGTRHSALVGIGGVVVLCN